MNAPIFIVGANRSGTTLLRLLLNAHSEIAIPDEINYFYGFYTPKSGYENWDTPAFSDESYTSFVDRFLEDNRSVVPGLDLEAIRTDILEGPTTFRRPYRTLLERWAEHQDASRWGEKTPGNIYHANILIDMFPDAQFIHVVRDPRAGVASMKRVSFFLDDVPFNALYRRKIMTHGRTWFFRSVPASQRIEIRYEDLVTDTEETLQSLCTFLELPYEPSMLRFHVDAEAYMLDEAASSYNEAATEPISDEKVDEWKSQLTDEEIAIVETVCRDQMEEFDYSRLNPSMSWRGALDLGVKWAYWWLQWWRHRHDRHFAVLSPMFSRTRKRLRRQVGALRNRLAGLFS